MPPLINSLTAICEVPATDRIHLGHPSVLALPGGRIFASVDYQGPDVRNLPGTKGRYADTNQWLQGRLFVSGDDGQTWTQKLDYPFAHGCLFRDGPNLYLLGQRGPLVIMRSADGGETWSKPTELTPKGTPDACFAFSPCSVTLADGHFHVALLRITTPADRRHWPHTLAPVLLRAAAGFNLTAAKSWVWSAPAAPFDKLVPPDALSALDRPLLAFTELPPPPPPGRDGGPAAPGWLFPHAVRVTHPRHAWHDPAARTTHVFHTLESPRGQTTAVARYLDAPDGTPQLTHPRPASPAVSSVASPPAVSLPAFLPLPGAGRRFFLRRDPDTHTHWLLAHESRGSLLRPEAEPADAPAARAAAPARLAGRPHLLALYFSDNLLDWHGVGWLAGSPADPLSDPAMDWRGRDLCLVACARDPADTATRHAKRLVFGLLPQARNLRYG